MNGYSMRPTYETNWPRDAILKSGSSAGKKRILDKWRTAFPECFDEILDMANVVTYEYAPDLYQPKNPVSGQIYEVGPRLILLDRLMGCINQHAGDGTDYGDISTGTYGPRNMRRRANN